MSENRLYLTCASHPEESAIMLGKRLQSAYGRAPSNHELNTWFDSHANCIGAPDCFKLAYKLPQNHDVDPIADPATDVKAAVKLALVKSEPDWTDAEGQVHRYKCGLNPDPRAAKHMVNFCTCQDRQALVK